MARDGLVNVGQLVREHHGREDVVVVGFGGHRGSVVAGSAWGAPMERMPVPEARPGSVEDLLHQEIGEDALLAFPPGRSGRGWLDEPRPHRAIGVVYHPERERYGNYVPTVLVERYDAFCFLEETAAVRPLGPEAPAPVEELETFPYGCDASGEVSQGDAKLPAGEGCAATDTTSVPARGDARVLTGLFAAHHIDARIPRTKGSPRWPRDRTEWVREPTR